MRSNIPADAYAACVEAANQSYYACVSLQGHTRETRDELHRMVNAAGPEGASLRAVKEANDRILQYGEALNVMEKRQDFLNRRLDHALKRLKHKNLWADNIEDLQILCEDRKLLHARAVLQTVTCAMHVPMIDIAHMGQLDDACWRVGIDLTMMENEPETASSEQLYGFYLEKNLARIYANTVMAAYAAKMGLLLSTDDYKDTITETLLERYKAEEAFQEQVQAKISDAVFSVMQTLEDPSKPEKKRPEPDEIKAARDKAVAKALAPVQAQAEKLKQENRELQEELSRLKSENEGLFTALENRDRLISGYAEQFDDAGSLPELPDSDVVFAGGHENMVKKLRQDHPGWTFIHGRDVNFPVFNSPKIIFFWDQHICHPTFWRVRKFAPAQTPQAYLKSTNLDMLESEMRRAWAAAMGPEK